MNPSSQPVFGNQPTMSNVASNGDIILTPDRESKDYKKLFLFGGVALAAILLLVAIIMAISNASRGSLRDNFVSFANYLIYEDKLSITDQNEDDYGYSAVKTQLRSSRRDEYFKELEQRFNTFEKSYNKSRGALDDQLTQTIDAYIDNFKLLYQISLTPELNDEVILAKYKSGSKDSILSDIQRTYKKVAEVNQDGADYATVSYKYAESYMNLISSYDSIGCWTGSSINYDCVYKHPPMVEEETDAEQLYEKLRAFENYLCDTLVETSKTILEGIDRDGDKA